jgi:hypothetical protein
MLRVYVQREKAREQAESGLSGEPLQTSGWGDELPKAGFS